MIQTAVVRASGGLPDLDDLKVSSPIKAAIREQMEGEICEGMRIKANDQSTKAFVGMLESLSEQMQ